MAINHYPLSPNTTDTGKHKFVQMPENAAIATLANEILLFSQSVGGVTQVFVKGETNGSEYQLTSIASGVDPNLAKFGTNTIYSTGPPSLAGGWTFLPGNLLMQYGSVTSLNIFANNPTTILFPRAFSAPAFSITISAEKTGNSPTKDSVYVKNGTITASQFQAVTTDTSLQIGYWIAIGPA